MEIKEHILKILWFIHASSTSTDFTCPCFLFLLSSRSHIMDSFDSFFRFQHKANSHQKWKENPSERIKSEKWHFYLKDMNNLFSAIYLKSKVLSFKAYACIQLLTIYFFCFYVWSIDWLFNEVMKLYANKTYNQSGYSDKETILDNDHLSKHKS